MSNHKTHRITVQVSAEEKAEIEADAKARGEGASTMIRRIALEFVRAK